MSSKKTLYAVSSLSVVVAKSLSFISALVVTLLLNRLLGKNEYGTYEFVMAIVLIISDLSLFGMDRVILYRVSRLAPRSQSLLGGEIVRFIFGRVAIFSIAASILFCVFAMTFESQFEFPNFLLWAIAMSIIIPLSAFNQVCAVWFQARQRLAESIIIPAIADVCRLTFLAIAIMVLPGAGWSAAALILAALVPLLVWSTRIPIDALRQVERITNWELKYGLKMMLTSVVHRAMQRIDIIMLGTLGSIVLTADFAVAARLSIFASIGNVLLAPAFAPRMGRLLAEQNRQEYSREYAQFRLVALAISLGAGAIFALGGPYLLGFFGDYKDSQSILLILCAANLVMVGFGPNGRYLSMAGHAGWLLISTLLLLVATIGFNFILIPNLGAEGAALGTLISFVLINVMISIMIWRLDQMATLTWSVSLILIIASAFLLLAAFDWMEQPIAGLGLCVLLGPLLFSERTLWLPAAKQLREKLRRSTVD